VQLHMLSGAAAAHVFEQFQSEGLRTQGLLWQWSVLCSSLAVLGTANVRMKPSHRFLPAQVSRSFLHLKLLTR
jgi:hypothetical protein